MIGLKFMCKPPRSNDSKSQEPAHVLAYSEASIPPCVIKLQMILRVLGMPVHGTAVRSNTIGTTSPNIVCRNPPSLYDLGGSPTASRQCQNPDAEDMTHNRGDAHFSFLASPSAYLSLCTR